MIDEHITRYAGYWLEPGTSVLEIGCGTGWAARRLDRLGYRVTALDRSLPSQTTDGAGVEFIECQWPEGGSSLRGATFDGAVLVRVLHALSNPSASLEAVARVLTESGIILVEDFDHTAGDDAAVGFLRDAVRTADAPPNANSFGACVLENEDPFRAWFEERHSITEWPDARRALDERFDVIATATGPQLTKLVEPLVGVGEAATLFHREVELIKSGDLPPLGRWFVGRLRR